jgi:hypothetical protein
MGLLYVHTLQYTYPTSTASITNVYVCTYSLLMGTRTSFNIGTRETEGERGDWDRGSALSAGEYTTMKRRVKGIASLDSRE